MHRNVSIAVAVVALAVASGCAGVGSPDGTVTASATPTPTGPSAAEIRQQSVGAMEDVETARYDLSMTVSTTQGTMTMNATGALDRAARKQRLDMEMKVTAGDRSRTIAAEFYFVNDTMYTRVEGQSDWQQRPIGDRNLWNNSQITRQTELLQAVSVTKEGTATVGGTETYVLAMAADDTAKLKQALAEQLSRNGNRRGLQLLENSEIETFDATVYVARDTNYIRKMDLRMTLIRESGDEMEMEMTITYSDLNGDVSIDVPTGATARIE